MKPDLQSSRLSTSPRQCVYAASICLLLGFLCLAVFRYPVDQTLIAMGLMFVAFVAMIDIRNKTD